MRLRSKSIAIDLSVGLVAVIALLSGGFGVHTYQADKSRLDANLHGRLEKETQQLEIALAVPLWSIDREQVDKVLESAMAEDDLEAVVLFAPSLEEPAGSKRAPSGSTHARARGPHREVIPSDGQLQTAGLLSQQRTLTFKGEPIGALTVYVTPKNAARELRQTLLSVVAGALALAVGALVSLALLLWRIVLAPLRLLEKYAVAVSTGGAASATWEQALRFRGEVEGLRGSLERMVSLLEERYAILNESERRFRTLFNSSNDAVLVCTVRPDSRFGAVLEANDVACRRLGYTRDEFLDLTFADLDAAPELGEQAGSPLLGKSPVFERQQRAKDGKLVPVEISARWFEMAGAPCVLCVARDISERRSLEAQLLQSQKMEAVGLLAGGIAHDFNNLLMVILGYADALHSTFTKDPAVQADIREITGAAQRAANLTGSLLAFSRRKPIEGQTQDLSEVVRRVEKLLRRVIGEDIALETALAPAPLYVHVDGAQIEQALINLCTNARDAMPRGGRITISTGKVTLDEEAARAAAVTAGKYAALEVADTGTGMDEATRARIFEPFFTTKSVGRGTGLGLSIVYGVIKQHGGQISVESAPGRGTRFRILLSLDTRGAKASAPGEEQRALGAGSETILLAEDDEGVRRLVELLLRRAGYTVLSVGSGQEAVELFRLEGERVQLVISDLVMPELDGREATRAMRRLRPHLPVLLLSGYSAAVVSAPGEPAPHEELLMKPVEPEVLLRKVRELLDRARPPAAQ